MKIEFKKIENEKYYYNLLIDGIEIEDDLSYAYIIGDKYRLQIGNKDLFSKFKKWSYIEFKKHLIKSVCFNLDHNNYFIRKEVNISGFEKGELVFSFLIQTSYEAWDNPYSVSKLVDEIKKNCIEPYQFYVDGEENLFNGFGIKFKLVHNNEPIGKWVDDISTEFELIYEKSIRNLIMQLNESSLVSYFNFPSEIESACKQYLIYFIEFLKDLGINAESNISTHSDQTIFTVTPIDKNHALELIKEMLNAYLNLPSSPEMSTINVINGDIGIQQLVANIQFFKSQCQLGNAVLQAKNATIDSLELTNFQLKQILDTKEKEIKKQNEGEDLIKGIVKVNKLENKGISINLGEILRRLKRKL